MKRVLCYLIVLIIALIACYLPFYNADRNIPFEVMKAKAQALVMEKEFKVQDKKYIRRQYQLSESDYQNIICYGPISAMEVNELVVVEAKDDAQKQHIRSQLKKHLDQQLESFQGYAPRQADLLQKAQLYEIGAYVILIVSEDEDALRQELDALFQKGGW